MIIKEICKIGKTYRLYKIIIYTGIIFAIDRRQDEQDKDWHLVESTADAIHLAKRMEQWGLAKNQQAALSLLNS